MTLTDEELVAWDGDGLPPAIESIRQRIDQLPRWQTIGILQGWWPILAHLDERLRELVPTYQLTQVKQKLGTLEVNMKGPITSDAVRDALKASVAESRVTCEVCGRLGFLRRSRDGWVAVYCDQHERHDDEQ